MKEASNHNNLSRRLPCLIIFIPLSHISFGWSHLNIWYYGARYKQNCHPDDLWTKYFTSSKHVKKFRKEHGEPDVIEVRRIFQTEDKTRKWETKVLKRMKVVKSKQWLNKTDNIAIDPKCCSYPGEKNGMYGKTHSEETKQKMSKSKMGNIPSNKRNPTF